MEELNQVIALVSFNYFFPQEATLALCRGEK